ncbi:hypothetical protein J1605_014283 [Eschrichtius robustus]|uniref:Calcitonin receptor-stimulating peptide 2 n=1 Tax=Eschrichtius robustus TaxID=9764 RepID=A0AB34GGG4_ESCRO|nr:hypothetical protein J1605_014283 [Eschrichtius robustus]
MGFWKFPPFLVLSILVLNQAGMLQAAPFRWALENGFDPATLTSKEMCLLLAAMMNDYVQMKAHELKQETGGLQKPFPSPTPLCTLSLELTPAPDLAVPVQRHVLHLYLP